jgi:hypothetical protein
LLAVDFREGGGGLVRFNVYLNLLAVECVHLQYEFVEGKLAPGTPFCFNKL